MDWVETVAVAIGAGGGLKVVEMLARGLDKRARAHGRRETRLDVLERARLVLWEYIFLLRRRMAEAGMELDPLPVDPADRRNNDEEGE